MKRLHEATIYATECCYSFPSECKTMWDYLCRRGPIYARLGREHGGVRPAKKETMALVSTHTQQYLDSYLFYLLYQGPWEKVEEQTKKTVLNFLSEKDSGGRYVVDPMSPIIFRPKPSYFEVVFSRDESYYALALSPAAKIGFLVESCPGSSRLLDIRPSCLIPEDFYS